MSMTLEELRAAACVLVDEAHPPAADGMKASVCVEHRLWRHGATGSFRLSGWEVWVLAHGDPSGRGTFYRGDTADEALAALRAGLAKGVGVAT